MILEIVGFAFLLFLGIYLLYVSIISFIFERGFCGTTSRITGSFLVLAVALLFMAFYLAPFAIIWSAK